MTATFVRVTLVLGHGHIGTVGRASHLVDLRGVTVPMMDKGGNGLACSADAACRFKASIEQMTAIAEGLEGLGFCGRDPEVSAVFDTSDVSTDYLLDVTLDDKSRRFAVFAMASGLEGPDKDRFEALIDLITDTAGLPRLWERP